MSPLLYRLRRRNCSCRHALRGARMTIIHSPLLYPATHHLFQQNWFLWLSQSKMKSIKKYYRNFVPVLFFSITCLWSSSMHLCPEMHANAKNAKNAKFWKPLQKLFAFFAFACISGHISFYAFLKVATRLTICSRARLYEAWISTIHRITSYSPDNFLFTG